jgi:hypothetical protein
MNLINHRCICCIHIMLYVALSGRTRGSVRMWWRRRRLLLSRVSFIMECTRPTVRPLISSTLVDSQPGARIRQLAARQFSLSGRMLSPGAFILSSHHAAPRLQRDCDPKCTPQSSGYQGSMVDSTRGRGPRHDRIFPLAVALRYCDWHPRFHNSVGCPCVDLYLTEYSR